MKLYILLVIMGTRQWEWGEPFDNIHACAGKAAAERHAQAQVIRKTGFDPGLKFICREAGSAKH